MLMGDFKINFLNAEKSTDKPEIYENISSHFFVPYILQPTRLTKNSKILINNIFLNFIKFNTKHNNYKRIRNIVVSKIKEQKKQYYQNNFQRNSKNFRKTQDGIISVVTLKSKAKTSPNSLFVDSNIIAKKTSIAEIFNNFL